MTNKKNKAHLTLLEVKTGQKEIKMNQQFYYLLALGVSVVHTVVPVNRATFLEETIKLHISEMGQSLVSLRFGSHTEVHLYLSE